MRTLKSALLSILLAFFVSYSVLAQCPGGSCPIPGQPPRQSPSSASQLDPSRYPEFVKVQIGLGRQIAYGTGTCFYYDEQNDESYVFSVAHVASRGQRGNVILHDGTQLPFECVDSSGYTLTHKIAFLPEDPNLPLFFFYFDETQSRMWQPEWSILRVKGKIPKQRLVRSPEDRVSVGDKAYVIGWSGGKKLECRLGTIIRLENGIIIVNVPAIPGQSGGAIVLQVRTEFTQTVQDELVGLISATDGSNTIGIPISYVIRRIENAAWLPWRRQQEKKDEELENKTDNMQNRILDIEKRLERIDSKLDEAIKDINRAIEDVNNALKGIKPQEEIKPVPIPELGPKPEPQPQQSTPQPQKEDSAIENLVKEWSALKRWGLYVVIGIFAWLVVITLFGQGILFSNPITRLVTRLIPGKIDDVVVALLAAGENALAAYLSNKFGMSEKKFKKLQDSVKQLKNIVSRNS